MDWKFKKWNKISTNILEELSDNETFFLHANWNKRRSLIHYIIIFFRRIQLTEKHNDSFHYSVDLLNLFSAEHSTLYFLFFFVSSEEEFHHFSNFSTFPVATTEPFWTTVAGSDLIDLLLQHSSWQFCMDLQRESSNKSPLYGSLFRSPRTYRRRLNL